MKALPIKIPKSIAINTVEIGLLVVPKISIANTLLIPCENKKKIKASVTPGKICFTYISFEDTVCKEQAYALL